MDRLLLSWGIDRLILLSWGIGALLFLAGFLLLRSPPVDGSSSQPPASTISFSDVAIGRSIQNDQLVGAATSFEALTPLVLFAHFANASAYNDHVIASVWSGDRQVFSCSDIVLATESGTYSCPVNQGLEAGSYTFRLAVNGQIVGTYSFTVMVHNPEPVPAPVTVPPRPATNALPRYPDIEQERGHEGSGLLKVCVEQDGSVSDVTVTKSSGYERLDQAAREWARGIQWVPATADGNPTRMCVDFGFKFQLRN